MEGRNERIRGYRIKGWNLTNNKIQQWDGFLTGDCKKDSGKLYIKVLNDKANEPAWLDFSTFTGAVNGEIFRGGSHE